MEHELRDALFELNRTLGPLAGCQSEEDFFEEAEAIHNGTATQLIHCYLCYLEATGKADTTPKADLGPLRGVVKEGTCYGFNLQASRRQGFDGDPYASYKLSCGHVII
jgi:hypothetical protein